MNKPVAKRRAWTFRHLTASLVLVGLGVVVTADIWADLGHIALRDEESSHVWLVPIVAGWLVWFRRERLRDCPQRHTWIGPTVIAAGWLLSTVGYGHAIQSFWHGGAVLVVAGCFLTVAGGAVLWRFLPAFAVLVFLVPVPGMARQRIAIPLQSASAQLAQAAFDIIGLDVTRTGNVLSINGVDVAVAEACNGMRMVFALILVSYAFAFGTRMPSAARLLIIVASPLAAVVCNVIRLIPTVWLYGNYTESVAVMFHDISGWAMLPIAFLLLLGITQLARWVVAPTT